MELAPELAQERASLVGEGRREAHGGIERIDDLEELGGIEPAAASRPFHGRTDVVRGADPDAGPFLDERPRLVRLVETARHDHGIGRRLEGLRQPVRRRELRGRRQPLPDERELEEGLRPGIHRWAIRAQRARETDGWPAIENRHGRLAQSGPA